MDHEKLVGMDGGQSVDDDGVKQGVDDDDEVNSFYDHGFTFGLLEEMQEAEAAKAEAGEVEEDEDAPVVAGDLAADLHLNQHVGESEADADDAIHDLDVIEAKYEPFSNKLQFTVGTTRNLNFYDEGKGVELLNEKQKQEADANDEVEMVAETEMVPMLGKIETALSHMDKEENQSDGNISANAATGSDVEKVQVTCAREESSAASTAEPLSTHRSLSRVQKYFSGWYNVSYKYLDLGKLVKAQTNNKEEEEDGRNGVPEPGQEDISKAKRSKILIADAGRDVNGALPDADFDDSDPEVQLE